jgi:hypothetical protein
MLRIRSFVRNVVSFLHRPQEISVFTRVYERTYIIDMYMQFFSWIALTMKNMFFGWSEHMRTGAELNFRFGCVYFLKFDFIKKIMVGSPWWWCCHLPSVRCMPGWKPRKVDRVVGWGHRCGYLPHICVLDLKP